MSFWVNQRNAQLQVERNVDRNIDRSATYNNPTPVGYNNPTPVPTNSNWMKRDLPADEPMVPTRPIINVDLNYIIKNKDIKPKVVADYLSAFVKKNSSIKDEDYQRFEQEGGDLSD